MGFAPFLLFYLKRKIKMKIKAKNPNVVSMELIVPIDGRISIDAKGIADVSAKCAAELVKNTNDWDYLTKKDEEVENETSGESADEVDDEVEDEKDEREEFVAHLDSLTFAQLQDFAKEGGMPEEEWKKLTSKKLLKEYLLKKFDETSDEIEDDEVEE